MKATRIIEQQHRTVEDLFEQFEQADARQKPRIFEQIAKNLVAHDAIEREVFYPACEDELGDADLLGEALVEHGLVEFAIFTADSKRGSEELEPYVTVLKELVMHHVKEEEDELLPRAERELGEERLEELGKELEDRFSEAIRADFRVALRDALSQVLDGKSRTERRPTRSSPRALARTKSSRTQGRRTSPRTAKTEQRAASGRADTTGRRDARRSQRKSARSSGAKSR